MLTSWWWAQCSKHVEVYNKSYYKTRICAFSWLITKIIMRCTVSKTSKYMNHVTNKELPRKYFFVRWISNTPIPVAARSTALVCGRSLADIAGSDPDRCMNVCLLWLPCIVRHRSMRRDDHSSRGVLPNVCACVRVCVSQCEIRCNNNPLHLQRVGEKSQAKKE